MKTTWGSETSQYPEEKKKLSRVCGTHSLSSGERKGKSLNLTSVAFDEACIYTCGFKRLKVYAVAGKGS